MPLKMDPASSSFVGLKMTPDTCLRKRGLVLSLRPSDVVILLPALRS